MCELQLYFPPHANFILVARNREYIKINHIIIFWSTRYFKDTLFAYDGALYFDIIKKLIQYSNGYKLTSKWPGSKPQQNKIYGF